MTVPTAERRLQLLAALRAAGAERLRFEPERLRFSLGTSLGELHIPVQVAPGARSIVQAHKKTSTSRGLIGKGEMADADYGYVGKGGGLISLGGAG